MENRKIPALIALAGIVIAVVVFFFVANDDTADQETETTQTAATSTTTDETGDDEDEPDKEKPEKPAEPEVPQIEIQDGEPVGGALEFEVARATNIRFDRHDRCGLTRSISTPTTSPWKLARRGEVEFDVAAPTSAASFEVEIEDDRRADRRDLRSPRLG